jgi:hypothetical protein
MRPSRGYQLAQTGVKKWRTPAGKPDAEQQRRCRHTSLRREDHEDTIVEGAGLLRPLHGQHSLSSLRAVARNALGTKFGAFISQVIDS